VPEKLHKKFQIKFTQALDYQGVHISYTINMLLQVINKFGSYTFSIYEHISLFVSPDLESTSLRQQYGHLKYEPYVVQKKKKYEPYDGCNVEITLNFRLD